MFGRKGRASLRRGDKVIAVEQVRDIPEGTAGIIRLVAGQAWTRYWVSWETGEWMGTIDESSIVRADRYEEFKREREAKAVAVATAPAPVAAATSAPAEGAGGGAGAGGGRIPEHLLERSRQARARAAAAASS